jgi:hypothetical protein
MAYRAPARRSGSNSVFTKELRILLSDPQSRKAKMITLTFDTNVLLDYLDPSREHREHAKALVQLDDHSICEIRVVSRFTVDVHEGALRAQLDGLSICQRPRIPTIAQWDVSEWDVDFWADDEDEDIYFRLFNLIFPRSDPNNKRNKNRIAEVGHLMGHRLSKREIFVTRDRAMLSHAKVLRSEFGISVMSPDEALAHCSPK